MGGRGDVEALVQVEAALERVRHHAEPPWSSPSKVLRSRVRASVLLCGWSTSLTLPSGRSDTRLSGRGIISLASQKSIEWLATKL